LLEFGYGGRILRVDLTRGEFRIEELDPEWIKNAVGGRAANTKRLYEELDVECGSLDPENILIFGVGPLTGSLLPASAYFTVSAKSPLTGILGDSAAGGQFAAEMKATGFDQIIISGKAPSFCYLYVTEKKAELIECSDLKGRNIVDSTRAIRREQKDYGVQVAAVGPAGENCVLFASIVSSGNRVNGRTGMGAVMGSKNLKAVAVRGTRSLELADPLAFLDQVRGIEKDILDHPEYKKRYTMGTTMLMSDLNEIGILPTKHFQEGICDYLDMVSGQKLAETHKVKNKSCFNCHLHCSRYCIVPHGGEAEGPEFETLCSFTSRIGNSDLVFALEMNAYLNQMGMDSISTSEVIGWIMECQERGLIQPEDLGGLSLKWGEKEKIREVVRKIVHREGVGDRLAEGATKVSKSFSLEAQQLVMQVKGLDIICGDPRGIKAYGLTYAVASRGADHLRAEPYFELTNRFEEARKRFGTEKAADRLAEEGKAALVRYSEQIALLTDSLTMCKNIGLCMDVLNFERAADLLSSGTGVDYSGDSLRQALEESIELDHKLSRKFGTTREEDTLPLRFQKEALKKGPTKDSTVDIRKMVEEYYDLHGWDD
jgi:aldehyde:ferredoxin oxidoreductase